MSQVPRRIPVAIAIATIATTLAAPVRADELEVAEVEAAPASTKASSLQRAVTISVTSGPAGLEIEGRCPVRAMSADAWAVLTDYEGIPGFVSSMRESRVAERTGDLVVVEQVAVGRVFLFSRRMATRLHVREEPPGLIRFEDVLGKDFDTYRGSWRIEEGTAGDGIEIVYTLSAKPIGLPDVVARGSFKQAVRRLIAEVGAEIERRVGEAGRAAPADG